MFFLCFVLEYFCLLNSCLVVGCLHRSFLSSTPIDNQNINKQEENIYERIKVVISARISEEEVVA